MALRQIVKKQLSYLEDVITKFKKLLQIFEKDSSELNLVFDEASRINKVLETTRRPSDDHPNYQINFAEILPLLRVKMIKELQLIDKQIRRLW
jgi:hypothetical protein